MTSFLQPIVCTLLLQIRHIFLKFCFTFSFETFARENCQAFAWLHKWQIRLIILLEGKQKRFKIEKIANKTFLYKT